MKNALKKLLKKAVIGSLPTLIIGALVVVGAIVLMNAVKTSSWSDLFGFLKPRTTIDHGAVILEAIKKEAKLETIAMLERTDNRVEKADLLCIEIVRYLGLVTVTAGIDLEEITASDIVVTDNMDRSQTVTILLPPAIILHTELDLENDTIIKERELLVAALCTKGSQMPDAIIEAQRAAEQDAKNAALAAGILQKAEEQAGVVLQELLKKAGYPNVVIKYSQGEYSPGVDD